MFDDLAIKLHEVAVEKGFWDQEVDDIFVSKQLMMIVSEVVEVLEAVRKDKGEEEITKDLYHKNKGLRDIVLYFIPTNNKYKTVAIKYQ